MKKIITYCIIFLLPAFLSACADDKTGPMENNTTQPGEVSNVLVENMAGKVAISYTLPKDQDLLYVKAVYQLHSGATREVKASYYTDRMVLDGFRDAKEYEIQLYAVNRSEVASNPVTVKVYPLENPIWGVRRSMEISGDFSGVNIQANNPDRYEVSIELIIQDTTGKWRQLESIHSSAAKINRTQRGLDTLQYKVGATVRDRFLNYTDTLYTDIVPLYEQLLDKSKFSERTMPGDAAIQDPQNLLNVGKIWDGDASYTAPYRLVTQASDSPQWITFDMGQTARLSRLKLWNYGADPNGVRWFYYQGHMRYFQVWGTLEPNPDGSWDNWTLLGDFEVVKPSGLPAGEESNEDFEAGVAGFDFNFDYGPQVRYTRIKNLENWEGTYWFEIKEISLYGDPR